MLLAKMTNFHISRLRGCMKCKNPTSPEAEIVFDLVDLSLELQHLILY